MVSQRFCDGANEGPGMLTQALRRARNDESGFGIVEIVVASLILFFVATALFGLVSASTRLSITSKADTVAVNAANSFIEKVRELTFADVTQARINALAAASSTTVGGIHVSLIATMTPQWLSDQDESTDSPAYLYVTVQATAEGPIGAPFVVSMGTYVGGPDVEASNGVLPPVVTLTELTPLSGAVGGTAVPLGMEAQARGSGVTLTWLEITAGGSYLGIETSTTASAASLTGKYWDTTDWEDGSYEMRAQARDSRGQYGAQAWRLIVDNVRPSPPAAPAKTAAQGTSVEYRWSAVKDGRDWVPDYEITWFKQGSSASEFSQVGASAVVAPFPSLESSTTGYFDPGTFSRYYAEIRSRGPLEAGQTVPALSSIGAVRTAVHISRPTLKGSTVTVNSAGGGSTKATLALDLRCDTPDFGMTGSTVYRWQYCYAKGVWNDLAAGNSERYVNASWTAPTKGSFDSWQPSVSFRCLVTVTPMGATTVTVTVPSCVVGFSRTNTTVTSTVPVTDWRRWLTPPASTPAIDWGMWLL